MGKLCPVADHQHTIPAQDEGSDSCRTYRSHHRSNHKLFLPTQRPVQCEDHRPYTQRTTSAAGSVYAQCPRVHCGLVFAGDRRFCGFGVHGEADEQEAWLPD